MDLIAINIDHSFHREELEQKLNLTLTKGIESTLYHATDTTLMTFAQFNVICMINYPRHEVVRVLEALGVNQAKTYEKQMVFQDYPIIINDALLSDFAISNEYISLQNFSLINLLICAHVVSQSVALDVYEQRLADYYERSRTLIDTSDTYSIFKRAKLAKFAKQLVLMRHDMIIDLYLLDKPDIAWENEEVEMLYNQLAKALELKSRFDVVEYKLSSIKDDIVMVMDLTNHNHSSFLEWIIIVLIAVEIIMGLYEWFRLGVTG
jgi:uncharacterized Rmd1/YagE family protein